MPGTQPGTTDGAKALAWDKRHGLRDLKTIAQRCGAAMGDMSLDFVSGMSADGLTISGYTKVDGGSRTRGWLLKLDRPLWQIN
jgi:hypothetical protein